MSKLRLLFGIFGIAAILLSCEGPEGPPGFDGLNGADAPLPQVFEEVVSFVFEADNNIWRSEVLTFDGTVNGDIFQVFISFDPGFYTPLPASVFDEFGEFQYVFDHDLDSVELQIIGDSDLSGLDATSTDNVPIRVAIIPAELNSEFVGLETMDFESLMSTLNLGTNDIQSISRP